MADAARVLDPIKGQQGAIAMVVEPGVGGGADTFQVTAGSFEQAYCQVDDDGAALKMAQTLAPSGDLPAEWQCSMGPLSVGPHDIICFNGTTRTSVDVFAGDPPAYDPRKLQWTAAEIQANERAKAARIAGTTSRIG